MTAQKVPWYRTQGVTLVLLLIAAGVAVWAALAGSHAQGEPAIGIGRGIVLLVVGFLAGLLGGLIGTGGCSVMLPIIHFWMGFPAPLAVGTTLFAVVFTATSGAWGHLVRRNLDRRATLWLGGGGILGVLLGSWLFTFLAQHQALLGLVLGLIFLWPAIRMIWEGIQGFTGKGPAKKEGNEIAGNGWWMALSGFVVGIATGIAGLGGGYALVPGLIYFFSAPVYITMGTSLAVMVPLALVGGLIKVAQGFVALVAGGLLGGGTIVGAQVGAAIIKRFKPHTLKFLFGIYFLYVSLKFILGYFGVRIW
ncbi:MAG: sulfite exporter TauE/SafE family protein [Anaerolineae bacterium]